MPGQCQHFYHCMLCAVCCAANCSNFEVCFAAGEGREHAKWSPVATAWYKLLPEVVITKVITTAMESCLCPTSEVDA